MQSLALVPGEDPPNLAAESPLMPLGKAMGRRREIEWLVEGLLPRGSFVILAGEAKKGMKTTIATHLSLCLARGEPFLGLPTQKCKVAMLNLEDGEQVMLNRYYNFGVREGDDVPVDLLIDEDRYLEAIEIVKQQKPDVVIIDPLLEVELLMGVTSENAAIEMGTILRSLRRLARKDGITTLLMHHAGAKSEMRGSTTLRGSTDGWLSVKWMKKIRCRRLSWWLRLAEQGYVDLAVQYDEDNRITVDVAGAPVFGDDGESNGKSNDDDDGTTVNPDVYTRIVAALQEAGEDGLTKTDIQKGARVKTASVKPIIEMLLTDRLVEKKGRRYTWLTAATTPDSSADPVDDFFSGTPADGGSELPDSSSGEGTKKGAEKGGSDA